jgi:predicted anti-sigma-YlaC factor YlaD
MAEPGSGRGRDYTCQEIVGLASDYLEGAMTPEQMTTFEVHLNFCDGCFRFVDQVRETAAVAGALPEDEIPEELRLNVLAAFRDWKHR